MTLGISLFFLIGINQGSPIAPSLSHKLYVGIKLLTILLFIVFCGVRRLNMKKESAKYPWILYLVSAAGSLIAICF